MRSFTVAVAMPGSGSDADFVRRAFEPVINESRQRLLALEPDPDGVVSGYRAALDAAAESGPVLVAGVSLGAVVGLTWAAEHPENTAGVIAALPPWTGAPGDAPAALAARHTASLLRANGLDAVINAMRDDSPPWLAAELTRSWRAQWPALPDLLDEAAACVALDDDALADITVPVTVIGASDDTVHPFDVAKHWATHIPTATLQTTTLTAVGAAPSILGQLWAEGHLQSNG